MIDGIVFIWFNAFWLDIVSFESLFTVLVSFKSKLEKIQIVFYAGFDNEAIRLSEYYQFLVKATFSQFLSIAFITNRKSSSHRLFCLHCNGS